MRAATIVERARTGFAAAPHRVFLPTALMAGLLLVALWWVAPTLAMGVGLILLIVCVWQIAGLRRRVRDLADWDPLTGAASRSHFFDRLRGARQEGSCIGGPVSVAVLDCDDFKQINERFGHAVGDAVLIQVADVLSATVANQGIVGRIWGDAFGILLPGLSLEIAGDLLRDAERRLHARMALHGWPVTFSIGLACDASLIDDGDELLRGADSLMFAVKRRGRNGLLCRQLDEEAKTAEGQPSATPRPTSAGHPRELRSASPALARQT